MKQNKELKKRMENKSLLIWKMALASAISWEIAKLLGSNHPYLAPISVILCLQTTVNKSIRFSYHRMVGTVIGIVVVVLAEPYLKINGWTLGLLILIASYMAKWLKRDETAIHQVALTVLLVFVLGNKSGDYPVDRFRDTLIGALVAVFLHMIVSPPDYTKEAERNLLDHKKRLSSLFDRVSEWVQTSLGVQEGNELQAEIDQSLQELHLSEEIIHDAEDSLKYNLYAKKKELQACKQKVDYLSEGYTYLLTAIETFREWRLVGTITSSQQSIWAEQMKSLAPFFHLKGNEAELDPHKVLLVSLPEKLESQRFHVVLFQETVSLVKRISHHNS